MIQFSITFILLFSTTIASAQLYIVSYNDTADIGYICDGVTQNVTFVGWAGVNLTPSVPISVDSFTFSVLPQSDTINFQYLWSATHPFVVSTGGFYGSGPNWAAVRVGDDTLVVTGHYNGQFTSTANLIFHARNSPDLAMYGYTSNLIDIGGGNKIGGIQQAEETDTMHDNITTEYSYHTGDLPYENGGEATVGGDVPVSLRSCGGATIDSIYESGDFSEFSFDPFPSLPYTIPGDDSLVLNYEFSPKVVDESGTNHHYLIFHTTDGQYLTWSFEYKVYPASSVSEATNTNDELKVFPNPATDELQILGGQTGTLHLFDIMGRERMNALDDVLNTTLDVSHLESGTYFVRLGTQSAKVEIAR
jgi:Secretion system C-terminal sorting domain